MCVLYSTTRFKDSNRALNPILHPHSYTCTFYRVPSHHPPLITSHDHRARQTLHPSVHKDNRFHAPVLNPTTQIDTRCAACSSALIFMRHHYCCLRAKSNDEGVLSEALERFFYAGANVGRFRCFFYGRRKQNEEVACWHL